MGGARVQDTRDAVLPERIRHLEQYINSEGVMERTWPRKSFIVLEDFFLCFARVNRGVKKGFYEPDPGEEDEHFQPIDFEERRFKVFADCNWRLRSMIEGCRPGSPSTKNNFSRKGVRSWGKAKKS